MAPILAETWWAPPRVRHGAVASRREREHLVEEGLGGARHAVEEEQRRRIVAAARPAVEVNPLGVGRQRDRLPCDERAEEVESAVVAAIFW